LAEGERRLVFDTRGRRKHVVRVVYAILALLMGASLFLVVGPFSIGNLLGTNSTTSGVTILNEQAERTEAKLVKNPKDEALLLSLARTRIAAGKSATEVDPETGTTVYTVEGREEFNRAAAAWTRYLKQAKEPNPSTALLMSSTYFNLAETSGSLEEATANVKRAATTQRIAAAAQPTVNSLTTLAIYEYFSGDFAAGDKATKKAEALAPTKSEAKEISKQMAEYSKRGQAFQKQKKEVAKQEGSQRKEALENPLGGLSGSTGGSLGE
jgi:chaperonin cofactor prefoldin